MDELLTDEIIEIYKGLEDKLSLKEFKSRVEEKIEEMGGFCDTRSASLLIAQEFGVTKSTTIGQIIDGWSEEKNGTAVSVEGQVIRIDTIKEFEKYDGSPGRVANILISDDTGTIRTVLWDKLTDLIQDGDLRLGTIINLNGHVKEGYRGPEITAEQVEIVRHEPGFEPRNISIKEIKDGMDAISVVGRVLEIGDVRTFSRKNGTVGKVGTIMIGDITGKIRVTLWDDRALDIESLAVGNSVRISNAYAKKRYNVVELYVGSHGQIEPIDEDVPYEEKITPIRDIRPDGFYNVIGDLIGIEPVHEFMRKDGSQGRVVKIRIVDATGKINVSLWNEHVDFTKELDLGQTIKITDAFAKVGFNNEIDLSVGWRSNLELLKK
ncbi:replication factor A [Methanosarcinales archaeon]|nr:MAG: replication factor A [Methanosarcinales archaeon]